MKRYTPFVPSYSGHANFEEDEKGKWVKYEDVEEALKESYAIGYDKSIVDCNRWLNKAEGVGE